MDALDTIMTPEQVADYLQLDRETIYRYIRSGKLAASKLGRTYRVQQGDVKTLLEKTKVPRAGPCPGC